MITNIDVARALFLALLFVLMTPVFAQTYEYTVYVDSDNKTSTGCTVNTSSAVTLSGMDKRLQATVDGVTLQVTGVVHSKCDGGGFGTGVNIGGPYAVGLNIGIAGSDVIELSESESALQEPGANYIRYIFIASQGSADDVFGGGGRGFFLNLLITAIPTLATWGILLLMLGLTLIGIIVIRRNPSLGKTTMVILFVGCGVTWAANFVSDGLVGDWVGTEPLGSDAAGDATNGSNAIDIRNVFAAREAGQVFFRIDVTDMENSPPVANAVNVTYLEDAAPQTITLSGSDLDSDPLTFSTTSAPVRGTLAAVIPVNSTSATVDYTLTANENGADSFTYTANDGQADSAAASVNITITPVNDAPAFTKGANVTVPEDAGAQTIPAWAAAISAGPANESGQVISFNITGNTNPGLFSSPPAVNASNGNLTFTPEVGQYGTATITLNLSDDGGTGNGGVDTSAPQTFVINVSGVNDPPVAIAKDAGFVQANMPRTGIDANLTDGVTDPDTGVNGCSPTFSVASITDGSNGTVSNVNLGAGTFDFSPAPGFTGLATVNYTVSDSGCPGSASSAPATISLTVSSPIVWFVDETAAGGGNGTLGSAFQTMGEATTAIGANTSQHIFVYSGTYAEGASLNADSKLIGEGLSAGTFDSVFGLTPPPGTVSRPGLAGTRPQLGNTVTMHDSTQVRGLDIASTVNTGITATGRTALLVNEVSVTSTTGTAVDVGASDGTLSFTSVSANGAVNGIVLDSTTGSFSITGVGAIAGSGGTIQDTTSDGILLDGAMGTFTFTNTNVAGSSGPSFRVNDGNSVISVNSGSITQTGAGGAIDISAHTGSFTLAGSSVVNASNGTGLRFNNADGTYNFDGAVMLNGGNAGIDILGGSAGTFTFPDTTITYSGTAAGINISSHTGSFSFGALSSLNATNGTGLQLDNADGTYDFTGPITLNGGDAGIDIVNGSSSSFVFPATTTITNPTGPAVNIQDLEAPGTVQYDGSIVANLDVIASIDTTAAGTLVNFNKVGGNMLTSTGNPNGALFLFDLDGDLTMTTPTTVTAPTFSTIFATDGDGDWSFTDLTIIGQVGLNGGVDVFGNMGTVTFTNVNITTNSAGTGTAATGFLAGGNNVINVFGSSSVAADGGGALVLININEVDMTFDSLTSTNNLNSQIGFAGDDGVDLLNVGAGTFDVTGTTTVTSADGVAISVENTGATVTFSDIDLDDIGQDGVISGVAFDSTGSLTINGGTINNVGQDGVRIGSNFGSGAADFEINNVTFTLIGASTAEVANSGLAGSGNVAVPFSCNNFGGNTGFIAFNGGADTCP